MSWQERFQEIARKKREEFNEAEERRRQEFERRKRLVQRFGPVIEEIARVLGCEISKSSGLENRDEWELHPEFGHYVKIYFYADNILVTSKYSPIPFDPCFENIGTNDIEDKTLDDRLRNAIAECV